MARAAANATKWRRRKADRPAEILAAALDSFAERGFAATRLDDVAARAGVSKGTLYLYFASKEELFKAVVREALLPNLARAETMLADFDGPTPQLLEQFVTLVLTLISKSPLGAMPKLIISEAGNFPELAKFYVEEVAQRGLKLIAGIIERGIRRGEFRKVDLQNSARCVIAPVLFTALWKNSLEPHDKSPLDVGALAKAHVGLLLRGLAREGAR